MLILSVILTQATVQYNFQKINFASGKQLLVSCYDQWLQQKANQLEPMIKVATFKCRQKETDQRIIELKMKRLRQQLSQQNFQFSDLNCQFRVHANICVQSRFIAVQVKAKPVVGLFENVDFVITIFIEDYDYYRAPKIYNDRRIFHPNINPFTLEIVVPELVNWIPTNTLVYVLRRLKYTLIQPNCSIISNNYICKKAAYLYSIDRQNYREYMIQYSPSVLEDIVMKDLGTDSEAQMEEQRDEKKYISIGEILPMSRLKQYQQKNRADDGLDILNKRISQMKIDSYSEEESGGMCSMSRNFQQYHMMSIQ